MSRPTTTSSAPVNLDRTFDLLSHRHRRWVLMYMVEYDKESIQLETAVKIITRLEPHESAESVRAMLHHNHLGRLDRAGVVEYDADAGVIAFEDHDLIRTILENSIAWDANFADAI